jgi:hypothetical protein
MTPAVRAVILCALVGACGCSDEAETPSSPTTTSTGFTLSTMITSRGAASRSFVTFNSGTITATLTSATPAVTLGLGVGIPIGLDAGCSLTQSVSADAGNSGAQVIVTAEPGTYCVKVFDLGHVPDQVTFSATVEHP